ncbi:MAG: PaaI family thioesterase [Parvularculaceae bacterium]|jgi:uncharacterized protein (TIGR00369 family)
MMAEQHSRLACWLGFKMSEAGDGRIYAIAPGESHVGNPLIRALHGGIVSTFLEFAAVHELRLAIPAGAPAEALNINVDFLKSAKLAPLFARARIAKVGRRLAFVDCVAWQEDEFAPVAKAACSFSLAKSVATSLADASPAPPAKAGGAFLRMMDLGQ